MQFEELRKEENSSIKNCNHCKYINLTEYEQNIANTMYKSKPDHICLKYMVRVFHRNIDGDYIYPCKDCEGKGFEKR